MTLDELQYKVYEWKESNFPNSTDLHQFLGVVEEVGELSHGILKNAQGIRGDNHVLEIKDAVGDICIFLMNFCSMNNWSLDEILHNTWDEVSKRDWVSFPKDGVGGE